MRYASLSESLLSGTPRSSLLVKSSYRENPFLTIGVMAGIDTAFLPGRVFAERYQIIRALGQGSSGEVYHVVDLELDRESLALKVFHEHLLADERIQRRIQNEIVLFRQLSHSRIVRIFDCSVQQSWNRYVLMEYVQGCNLRELLSTHPKGRLSVSEAQNILRQVLEGVSFAHSSKILHRDLKPENLLLDTRGNLKITDFGLARSLEESTGLTRTGEAVGTPAYTAPEFVLSSVSDERSNIYSIGIVAFEILRGTTPFNEADYFTLAKQHISEAVPIDRLVELNVPEWYISFVTTCLAKNPNDRFPSAKAALEFLLKSADSETEAVQSVATLASYAHAQKEAEKDSHFGLRFFSTLGVYLMLGTIIFFCLRDLNVLRQLGARLISVDYYSGVDLTPAIAQAVGYPISLRNKQSILDAAQGLHGRAINALLEADGNFDNSVTRRLGSHLPYLFKETTGVINWEKIVDQQGNTPLHLAVADPQIVLRLSYLGDAFINAINKNEETALYLAVSKNMKQSVNYLVRGGADASRSDASGKTPLHLALEVGDASLISFLLNSLPLRRTGFNVRDSEGKTILHMAASIPFLEAIRMMLAQGVDINARDLLGRTALMHACEGGTDAHRELIDYLIANGADTTARDNAGLMVRLRSEDASCKLE